MWFGTVNESVKLGRYELDRCIPWENGGAPSHGPVDLLFCDNCHLVQLKQSYSLEEMYGGNYGYRSGLNRSMVEHLQNKIHRLEKLVALKETDLVLDIGSNDATSLKAYTVKCERLGIDPTSRKFAKYYTDGIKNVPDFFTKEAFFRLYPKRKAKVVTSIAMFYDLEAPISFAEDVAAVIADDGVWHFEQSYMPTMLEMNAYDTICHEHLEFYSLEVIKKIVEAAGLHIIDVEKNDINGGSFAITASKVTAKYSVNESVVKAMLAREESLGLHSITGYKAFATRVQKHRDELKKLIMDLSREHKVFGYGASTKGNVLLQYCGITRDMMPYIVEVNEEKFGAMTPGTNIPIISEPEGENMAPDYYVVLPWHFKENILPRVHDILERGAKFIFPLPRIEIIGKDDV